MPKWQEVQRRMHSLNACPWATANIEEGSLIRPATVLHALSQPDRLSIGEGRQQQKPKRQKVQRRTLLIPWKAASDGDGSH